MSSNYYYLVSGLPDLEFDEKRPVPAMSEYIAELEEGLDVADRKWLRVLRFPFDNANLIAILEQRQRPFDDRGNFTRDELVNEIKNPDSLPPYMEFFCDSYKEGRTLFPGLTPEDQLAWLFYESVAASRNPFIRDWFGFDLNLRNVLAALRCRDIATAESAPPGELIGQKVIGHNEVSDLLRRSSAPDFSLSEVFPEVEALLSLPREKLTDFEKQVDQLRWRFLDEQVFLRSFHVDAILAFVVKLSIAERWQRLDAEEGKQNINRLVQDLKAELVFS